MSVLTQLLSPVQTLATQKQCFCNFSVLLCVPAAAVQCTPLERSLPLWLLALAPGVLRSHSQATSLALSLMFSNGSKCFQMFSYSTLGKPSKILMPPPPLLAFEKGGGVPPKSQLSPKRLDFLLKLYSWIHSKVILETCRLKLHILGHYTVNYGQNRPLLAWK